MPTKTTRSRKKPIPRRRARRSVPPKATRTREQSRQRTVLALLGVLCVELIAIPFTSPYFRVKRMAITGTKTLLPAEAKQVEENLRISKNTNWFLAPLGSLEGKLKTLPYVKVSKARHLFPNGIAVQVTPREPIAILNAGGEKYEIDNEGILLRVAREEMASKIPEVIWDTDQSKPELVVGKAVSQMQTSGVLQTLVTPSPNPTIHIDKIAIDPHNKLCLNMSDHLLVHLGKNEHLKSKLSYLTYLYQKSPAPTQEISLLDLDVIQFPDYVKRGDPLPRYIREDFPLLQLPEGV